MRRSRASIGGRALLGFTMGVALVLGGAGTAAQGEEDIPQPVDFAHNVTDAPAPVAGAVFGTSPSVKTGTAICTTGTSNAANVNTDCAPTPGPHNETSIAVNPTNPLNI